MKDTVETDDAVSELRVDKWLWAARFFKTRSASAEAINGGKVQVNGKRVKPSRAIRPGDELQIRRGPYEYVVIVQGINAQRRPAKEATLLYRETDASVEGRQTLAAQRKAEVVFGQPHRRPNKKQRRQLARFRSDYAAD